MTKSELFEKYNINETHNKWEAPDSWYSVEIHRIMHNGDLPNSDNSSIKWVIDFIDKFVTDGVFVAKLRERKDCDWGSLYLTAKRMIYQMADEIIAELS